MSGSVSANTSRKSILGWKLTAGLFIILTIGASGTAYYYYSQTQNKILGDSNLNSQISQLNTWLDGNKTQAANYHARISTLQSQLDTLGSLNASQTSELAQDKTAIASLQSNGALIQSQLTILQTNYSTLLGQNTTLTAEFNALTFANGLLEMSLHSLALQLGNLTMIVDLQASTILAPKDTPLTWTEGTTSFSVPQATLDYNYSGYIDIVWHSTDPLTFQLSYSLNTNSTIIQSSNSATEEYSIPITASPLSPTSATASFLNTNTDCLFHSCAGTVYVTITYWY